MQSDLNRLKIIFKKMSDDGFDFIKPLKWGFFFFDTNKAKLLKVFNELKEQGYAQDDLNQMDDGEWRLYVTKIDTLTPEKLHKRNIAFNELAQYFGVMLYDGWDVEKL